MYSLNKRIFILKMTSSKGLLWFVSGDLYFLMPHLFISGFILKPFFIYFIYLLNIEQNSISYKLRLTCSRQRGTVRTKNAHTVGHNIN